MNLTVYPKGYAPAATKSKHEPCTSAHTNLSSDDNGKMILFKNESGLLVAGEIVKRVTSSHFEVKLAVPNGMGLLVVTKSTVVVDEDDTTFVDAAHRSGDVKAWQSNKPVEGVKSVEVKGQDGAVTDLRDVSFDGYGSTFKDFTPADRDGDGVNPEAFAKSIEQFRKNPVMLVDHNRSVHSLAGSYSSVSTDSKGLRMTGKLSNAPGLRDVRFLVNEGHLKTLSMGGMFFFNDDLKTIDEVDLHEVSLVVVPANPDAEVGTRSLDAEDAGKAFAKHAKKFGGEVRSK